MSKRLLFPQMISLELESFQIAITVLSWKAVLTQEMFLICFIVMLES